MIDMTTLRHYVVKSTVINGTYTIKKDRSERYQVISRGWELCGEEDVSDNDTSGQAVRSEKMVKIQ